MQGAKGYLAVASALMVAGLPRLTEPRSHRSAPTIRQRPTCWQPYGLGRACTASSFGGRTKL